jgi:hypothetical protein
VKIPAPEGAEAAHDRALKDTIEDPHNWCFYTDGNEIEGHVGAAAYNGKSRTHRSVYLGTDHDSNVYAAELTALNVAL